MISLAQAVIDPAEAISEDGKAPSETDAARLLDAYIGKTLAGGHPSLWVAVDNTPVVIVASCASAEAMNGSRCIPGPSDPVSASFYPDSGMGCPGGDNRPKRGAVAVQIPVGEVERRSLDVYELAVGGVR